LLCSDGLGKELSDDQVLKVAMETPEPSELVKRLIDVANAAGGRDNITVAVARIDKADWSASIKSFFKSIIR
jgi:PPM family protein phosphatase